MGNRKIAFKVIVGLLAFAASILVLMIDRRAAAQGGYEPQAVAGIYDDGKWVEIGGGSATGGGVSNNSSESRYPSLAIGPNGKPMVAWEDDSDGDFEIYVSQWNGVSWVDIGKDSTGGGGISDNDGKSYKPSLAFGLDGLPVIAWSDYSTGDWQIYVRRWNGESWVEMGSSSAKGGGISDTTGSSLHSSLAIGADGVPVIAWDDNTGGVDDIYVRRWNGASWAELGNGSASGGGISNNDGDSHYPSLALDPEGNPFVAWSDKSYGYAQIYIRHWNGVSWAELGSSSASRRGISDTSEYSRYPSLAVDSFGFPIVAWQESKVYENQNPDIEIYARRWNGESWVAMGNSASGEGISGNNYYMSVYPSLKVDPYGAPIVAWFDWSIYEHGEIHARRWTGHIWRTIDSANYINSGVSNNIGRSRYPSLDIGPFGELIVAWEDDSDGDSETYVRRWHSGDFQVYTPVGLSGYHNLPPMKGNQEQEPNDKWHQANGAIRSGTVYHGAFSRSGDASDYFYFYLAQAGTAAVKLNDIPAGHNYDLVLRDSDLKQVGYSGELNNDNEHAIENLPRGIYYIQVYNRDGGTSAKQYALQVNYEG